MPNTIKSSSQQIATIQKRILTMDKCCQQTQNQTLTVDFTVAGPYIIPAGYTTVTAYLWGGDGAQGLQDLRYPAFYGGVGGSGAYLTGVFPVTSGDTVQIVVGQVGAVTLGGTFGGGNGGAGAGGGGSAGGGGGLSSLSVNGTTFLVAGGGGGGGGAEGANGQDGGAGGNAWTTGNTVAGGIYYASNGADADANGGLGGSLIGGIPGGQGATSGLPSRGGRGGSGSAQSGGGGGGGAGYFGGGGGGGLGASTGSGGGGGGGSSFVNPIVTGPTIGIDTTFQPSGHVRLVLS